jgi:hypothetical protein
VGDQLRIVCEADVRSLYCVTGNSDFRRHDLVPPACSVIPLLRELVRDPTASSEARTVRGRS